MKVFVAGANGQLGYDVINELLKRDFGVICSDISSEYVEAQDQVKYV